MGTQQATARDKFPVADPEWRPNGKAQKCQKHRNVEARWIEISQSRQHGQPTLRRCNFISAEMMQKGMKDDISRFSKLLDSEPPIVMSVDAPFREAPPIVIAVDTEFETGVASPKSVVPPRMLRPVVERSSIEALVLRSDIGQFIEDGAKKL